MTDTPAAPAPVDPWSMTPDQATAALASMHAELHPPRSVVPQDAQDARATLDRLIRDPTFANSLLSGSTEAKKHWDALHAVIGAGDDLRDMVAGIHETSLPLIETTAEGALPRRAVEATISGLRDSGLNDASIEQAINLPPISRAEAAAAEAFWARCQNSAEWRNKFLAGDYEAVRQHKLVSVLRSSPIAKE
jgi:hypothetical protein